MFGDHAAAGKQIGMRLDDALGQAGRAGGEENGCGFVIVDACRCVRRGAEIGWRGERAHRHFGRLAGGGEILVLDEREDRTGQGRGVGVVGDGRLVVDEDHDRAQPPDRQDGPGKLGGIGRPDEAARTRADAPPGQIDRHRVGHGAEFAIADGAITADQGRAGAVGA